MNESKRHIIASVSRAKESLEIVSRELHASTVSETSQPWDAIGALNLALSALCEAVLTLVETEGSGEIPTTGDLDIPRRFDGWTISELRAWLTNHGVALPADREADTDYEDELREMARAEDSVTTVEEEK